MTCAFDRFARSGQREKEASSFSRGEFVFRPRSKRLGLEPTPTRYAYAAPARRRRRVAKCT